MVDLASHLKLIVLLCLSNLLGATTHCGLFVLEFAERLYGEHKEFIKKAKANNLCRWFKPNLIDTRREEIAILIRNLSEEQRKPGGALDGEKLVVFPELRLSSRIIRRTNQN